MRFSEAWLREWVNPDIDTDTLSHQLSMAGLEVDSVVSAAAAFSGVLVGEVLEKTAHPDADKLSVCQVSIGAAEPLQIVCGAKNVAAGMKVPVAIVGAILPGDFKIKDAKLRGVASQGMICSASELGLAESSDGIMPLPVDAPVGEDIRQYLDLDDTLIEVDLTPDRGDCLSIAGIARDVGVINREAVTAPVIPVIEARNDTNILVEVSSVTNCPKYVCRVISDIDMGAATPMWMVERLRRGGIRAINPVADVTNYVLLELGQPMHGFDLDKLSGGIQVRLAQQNESLTLLDGNKVDILPDTLLIADANGPLALAGIMGGEASGVGENTSSVLLESAFFHPLAIVGKARAYGLHTDSSHRFERGVDPDLQIQAIERATGLLVDIVGGIPGPVVAKISEAHLPVAPVIHLRRRQISRVLGIDMDDTQVEDVLGRLGMTIVPMDNGWDVVPPSARFDITIEVDLIEELGRIYGYENIPMNLSAAPVSISALPETAFNLNIAKRLLVNRDYLEVITYSFISPKLCQIVTPGIKPIALANPISTDLSVMRTSLWPGLLQTLQYNLARQQDRVRIFESGLQFINTGEGIQQQSMLAGLVYGSTAAEQWGQQQSAVDFYDCKADVEAILTLTGEPDAFHFAPGENESLHPGQCAEIFKGSESVGYLGMLHPAMQAELGINETMFLFQLRLEGLKEGKKPAFVPLSKYPAIRRDFALVVDRAINFADIEICVRQAAPKSLKNLGIFDVYTGENVDSALKSIAISLILQETSHTLTEQEIDLISESVLKALENDLSAKLRD